MVFIMENNSFFPGSPCIDACFFFFVLLFFIIFFFPLKLHVIDRTAAYTCGTRTLQQLSPLVSIYLEKNSFIIPLPSHPSQICGFSFCFSLFSPHEISSRIINSFLRFETRETHPALYPPPLKLISLAQTAAKWAKFPECGPRLGPATNVWRVWFLSSVSTTNGEPAAILAVPPPPLQQLMGSRAGVKRDASWIDWKNHQELRMELPIPGRRLKPPCCVTWKSNRPLVPRLYSGGGGSLPVTQMRAQLGPRIGYIYVCTWAFSRREKKGGKKKKREREKRRQVEKMAFELEQVSTSVPLFFIPFLAWKI